MTKPGFLLKRIQLLFESDDIDNQLEIVEKFSRWRKRQPDPMCYCGHTITCDCGGPHISEFKMALQTGGITETDLMDMLDLKH